MVGKIQPHSIHRRGHSMLSWAVVGPPCWRGPSLLSWAHPAVVGSHCWCGPSLLTESPPSWRGPSLLKWALTADVGPPCCHRSYRLSWVLHSTLHIAVTYNTLQALHSTLHIAVPSRTIKNDAMLKIHLTIELHVQQPLGLYWMWNTKTKLILPVTTGMNQSSFCMLEITKTLLELMQG